MSQFLCESTATYGLKVHFMKQVANLSANLREKTGKSYAKFLRRQGKVPAVIYGKAESNILLELDTKSIEKIIDSPLSTNTLIHLQFNGKEKQVIIKDFSGDIITRQVKHVDFVIVKEGQEILAKIPVHVVGRAQGQIEGGIVDQIYRQIELLCKPGQIPPHVEVDITELKLGQSYHLSDITLPEGVKIPKNYNPTLVTITTPKEDIQATATAAPADAKAGAKPAAGKAPEAKKDDKKPAADKKK